MLSTTEELFPLERARAIVKRTLNELGPSLRKINQTLHSHPETAYEEKLAHETLARFLETQGFAVCRHAWGLDTSFEATFNNGGPQVIFCAEYDALPTIGHACGHNLIATSSLASFLAAARTVAELKIPGRLRIIGTPAEEGGGGKIKLIEAGAFHPPEDVAAAIMAHPTGTEANGIGEVNNGLAGTKLIASYKMRVEFRGHPSHAGAEPWDGVNALDAAVGAYNNVSMLRQHIRPDERIHGIFESAGDVPNVVPGYTRMNWHVRSPTTERCKRLVARVKACIEAGAAAAGCEFNYIVAPFYYNLLINTTLCRTYVEEMGALGLRIEQEDPIPFEAATDMGNVSHLVPSFHGSFPIPTAPGISVHKAEFTACAGTDAAHQSAIECANGMAMLAIRLFYDKHLVEAARRDFENRD